MDFYNNLIHTASSAYWSYSNDGANATFRAEFIPNYNGYYNITSANFFLSDANYTYSEWQAIWGDANSPDSTSVTGTAIFTDAANDNYRIVAGHDALTAGNTGGELGCYANVDTVGVLGSLGGETPAAPSSVTLKMTFQED